MNVGAFLKQKREEKGLTMGQVADETKISIRYIEAIEEGRFDYLPSQAYAKGFLKLYAKCVGASSDEVVLRYETTQLPPLVKANPQTRILYDNTKKKERGPSFISRIKFDISGRTAFIIIAILVVVLAAVLSIK